MTFLTNNSIVSTNNATTVNLGANQVYIGTGEDVTTFSSILINIISSHDSKNGGISIEFSQDNSNWDIKILSTYIAPGNKTLIYDIQGIYFRIKYTNGSIAQTLFRLQCIINVNKHGAENTPHMVGFDDNAYDAFHRVRVSNPFTIFQVSHNMGKQPMIMTEKLTNGGTSDYIPYESAVNLTTTITNGSSVIRQSRRYITSQPGKSLQILLTERLKHRILYIFI